MTIISVRANSMKVGDVVQVEDWPSPATVTSIQIVFHMDNNMDLVAAESDEFWVIQKSK